MGFSEATHWTAAIYRRTLSVKRLLKQRPDIETSFMPQQCFLMYRESEAAGQVRQHELQDEKPDKCRDRDAACCPRVHL
jgi:hypothetical protein